MSEKTCGRVMTREQKDTLKEPEKQNNVALVIFQKVELNPFYPKQGFDSKKCSSEERRKSVHSGETQKAQD